MVHDVFISYASTNEEEALRVRHDLEADGIRCWFATRDVQAAADYAEVIPEVIRSSSVLLLLLSSAAAASPHVEREVHLAADRKIPILPVRLEAIEPKGSFEFFLAGRQRIDAFPRVEPKLGEIRAGLRRLISDRRPPLPGPLPKFRRVIAGTTAWLIVAALSALAFLLVKGHLFNLVPAHHVLSAALSTAPSVLMILASVPIAAFVAQYWSNRNLRYVLTLDALFGTRGSARWRLVAAAVLAILLGTGISMIPPSVQVRLEPQPLSQYTDAVRIRHCPDFSRTYRLQMSTHYAVYVRANGRNPRGDYALTVELAPHATQDGVEFCGILLDRRLSPDHLTFGVVDARRAGYIRYTGTLEDFTARPVLRFSARHYRDSVPAEDARVTAVISSGDYSPTPHEEQLSSAIWPANKK